MLRYNGVLTVCLILRCSERVSIVWFVTRSNAACHSHLQQHKQVDSQSLQRADAHSFSRDAGPCEKRAMQQHVRKPMCSRTSGLPAFRVFVGQARGGLHFPTGRDALESYSPKAMFAAMPCRPILPCMFCRRCMTLRHLGPGSPLTTAVNCDRLLPLSVVVF
ncbi:hypothetical protein BC832DRAFT_288180 [Gaertneriomyces semiglobifer]|nr:hypothetical protein BC832DRAFT_288180 [Gaertneriomyces semiglobifer]